MKTWLFITKIGGEVRGMWDLQATSKWDAIKKLYRDIEEAERNGLSWEVLPC